MNDADQFVGHKTFSDGQGGHYHEPLTRAEADAIWAECERLEAKRAEDMPTEQDAINAMFEAYQRLRELGWREAMYCPKDGSIFKAIEVGSTGIHDCFYLGEWPKGNWEYPCEGDLWPSRPILFKPAEPSVQSEKPEAENG